MNVINNFFQAGIETLDLIGHLTPIQIGNGTKTKDRDLVQEMTETGMTEMILVMIETILEILRILAIATRIETVTEVTIEMIPGIATTVITEIRTIDLLAATIEMTEIAIIESVPIVEMKEIMTEEIEIETMTEEIGKETGEMTQETTEITTEEIETETGEMTTEIMTEEIGTGM